MSTGDLLGSAKSALLLAKKHGASDASATVSADREIETTWRDGKIEKVSEAASRQLAIALYVDGKFGSMTTSDLRPDALDRFVGDAVALVRALAKDPYRKLPDPALYAGRTTQDLQLFDPSIDARTADARLAVVKAREEGARSGRGHERITTVTTSASDNLSEMARVTTNGFEGSYRSSSCGIDASVSIKDDDGRRPEDEAGAFVRFASDLPDAHALGREATERATGRLGAKKVASGTMPMLVEARAAGGLLRHLLGPLRGSALQQKQSFLDGKLGAAVASKAFTLTDEPWRPRGLASRPFDSEGIATKTRPVLEAGVLRTFFLDVYYAAKMNTKPTTGSTTNLVVAPGKKSLDALAKDMKNGILVTSFLGGNSNSTTGIFSLGLSGYRIANGERVDAIGEMNLSGSHLDFWKKLTAVGNDPYPYSSLLSPSLLFDGVSIAGT